MGASQIPVMRLPSIRHCRLATIIIAAAASGFYFGCYWTMSPQIPLSLDACDPHTSDIDFLRDIARQLDEAVLELNGCRCAIRAVLALQGVLALLDPRRALSAEEVLLRAQGDKQRPAAVAADGSADACAEVYTGARPSEGFVTAPGCRPQDKPPLEALVTAVLLAPPPLRAAPDAPLDALRQSHPRLPAVVAAPARGTSPPAHDKTAVVAAGAREFASPGALLNRLVRQVRSPYALLARDAVRVDEAARLQRLLYVVSALGDRRNASSGRIKGSKGGADTWGIAVAGGAVRDPQGHWSVGCAQTTLRNYALRVQQGYRFSALDCMLCDQLRGPFLARTSLLREVAFSEHLPASVVFEDWFLRAKRRGALAAACPDSLFFVGGGAEGGGGGEDEGEDEERGAWRQLAAAWQVDRVLLPGRPPLRFSCKEVGFQCDLRVWQNKSLLNPTCCVEQLTGAFAAFDHFAARHKFDYELNDGTALGAVKLQNALPWDIDGDIVIVLEDFEKYKEAKGEMSAQGYLFKDFIERNKSKYFIFYTPEISIDMWSRKEFRTMNFPKEMQNVFTTIKMVNMWMRGPWNPGYFVRNRYGPGYLKHAQHWRNLGFETQWTAYTVGSWRNCSLPNHHACLNKYPSDGSFNLLPDDFP